MSKVQAIGDGPVRFFTDDGVLLELLISEIYFEDGAIGTTRWPNASPAKLLEWLMYLAKRGDLVPAAKPPTPSSLIAKAVDTGPNGNRIQIEVKAVVGDSTKVDVAVSEVDVHEGLTLATLTGRLAATGLLCVSTNMAGAPDPIKCDPVPVTLPVGPAAPPTWVIANTAAAPFMFVSLEPKRMDDGFASSDFKIVVSDVQPAVGGATFTLTVTWKKTLTGLAMNGALATKIPEALEAFKYLVTFEAPPGGWKLPRPGAVTLFGGRDPAPAVHAAATLLAND